MKSLKEIILGSVINEIELVTENYSSYPEEFKKYLNSNEFSIDKKLPDEFNKRNIIEKGYSSGAKMLSWSWKTNNAKWETDRMFAYLSVRNESVVIRFLTYFEGRTGGFDSRNVGQVSVEVAYPLTFNKSGMCTGIGKEALYGTVNGGNISSADVKGMSLSSVKGVISKAIKTTY